ncbi:MAG: metal ABC transporter permease [Thermoguttaceae bacterium]|nr:metal ABC transporter permease [Thermoguttaceae bacterium]MDW8079307.1 metal ABC transporter permease [Thermoguttaceae bacterium]
MIGFLRDLPDNPFLLTGLLAGLLSALACGLIGPYVVGRRMVLLSGAIAHAAVGGVGLAIFLAAYAPTASRWIDPLTGGLIVAVAAAIFIAVAETRWGSMPETLLAAMWALGMSLGVLLAKMTPGYQSQLMAFLFGNISYVSWRQVKTLVLLDALLAAATALFHKQFLAFCLDREQAELQGVSAAVVNGVLLVLAAIAVIVLAQVVGLVMVITLLTLPAATAAIFVNSIAAVILVSTLVAAVLTTLPRMLVYGTVISAESAIVIAAVGTYLAALAVREGLGRLVGKGPKA